MIKHPCYSSIHSSVLNIKSSETISTLPQSLSCTLFIEMSAIICSKNHLFENHIVLDTLRGIGKKDILFKFFSKAEFFLC